MFTNVLLFLCILGNAMGFKSVDGAISENLETKGNKFCPNMNKLVQYKYIPI